MKGSLDMKDVQGYRYRIRRTPLVGRAAFAETGELTNLEFRTSSHATCENIGDGCNPTHSRHWELHVPDCGPGRQMADGMLDIQVPLAMLRAVAILGRRQLSRRCDALFGH